MKHTFPVVLEKNNHLLFQGRELLVQNRDYFIYEINRHEGTTIFFDDEVPEYTIVTIWDCNTKYIFEHFYGNMWTDISRDALKEKE